MWCCGGHGVTSISHINDQLLIHTGRNLQIPPFLTSIHIDPSVIQGHSSDYYYSPVLIRATVHVCLCSSGGPLVRLHQLGAPDCVTPVHTRQMRRGRQSAPAPACPLKAGPGGEEVPQMACEVYIHCPLLNRLALMKCLMPGPLADIILPGSSAPWLPKKPPSLQPASPSLPLSPSLSLSPSVILSLSLALLLSLCPSLAPPSALARPPPPPRATPRGEVPAVNHAGQCAS